MALKAGDFMRRRLLAFGNKRRWERSRSGCIKVKFLFQVVLLPRLLYCLAYGAGCCRSF